MNLIEMLSARPAPVCGYRVVKGRAQGLSPDVAQDRNDPGFKHHDRLVHDALQRGVSRTRPLAEETGLALSSVFRALRRLEKAGSAKQENRYVWVAK